MKKIWCTWSYLPFNRCPDHDQGHPHREVASDLGLGDEPQASGALVAVWRGDYRQQEVWVASGANIGNWYCLGGEFGRPRVWHDTRTAVDMLIDPGPKDPPDGQIPVQPTWYDVLKRGPVTLLTAGDRDTYRDGWRNGRRALVQEVESLGEEDSTCDR